MSDARFEFASGNLQKLLALPKYLLGAILAFFVPRSRANWVFGSGIGVGEGALALARLLHDTDETANIRWVVANEVEGELAKAEGIEPVLRHSWAGFWATLRARQIVVTHGAGDVNRFGVFGGHLVHLIHGAPLKKLHLDSPATMRAPGPAFLGGVLKRMYVLGTRQVSLFVAGSITAAERLRSAYRVAPGKVKVLGDPRSDVLCELARDPERRAEARARLLELLGIESEGEDHPIVLYAPTWRDGDPDPAVPTEAEAAAIKLQLERAGVRLVIRSHPLGEGVYDELLGDRVHLLGTDLVREITPLLAAFDAVVTDYSSIAIDFALFSRPIVWFAPDLDEYLQTRGLYEPLEVTAAAKVHRDWTSALTYLEAVLPEGVTRNLAVQDARALAARFYAYPEGRAAERVLDEIRRLSLRARDRVPAGAVFFESFYGRQVTCNPLAIDREIARRSPETPRFWSVESERLVVPEGSTALLVGSPDWRAVRRHARLLVVNDWLRFGFRRRRGQVVLQTWHGTMLKHLALSRPKVSLRTRLAVHRESRRWSLLLSQNPHSTGQFRESYAYRGEVIETGYPRDDRLADAMAGGSRMSIAVDAAKRSLGVPTNARVLSYAPTWRDNGSNEHALDVQALAASLGEDWVVVARGHTRSAATYLGGDQRVIDASAHPDVNDVILAADLLITDYSSVMFDAAVARVPMAFYVPDLAEYRDRERGFTFDFEATAPGPLLTTQAEVVSTALAGVDLGLSYEAWRETYTPHDDGGAAARVVDALIERGALTPTSDS